MLIDRSGRSFDQAELMIYLLLKTGNCSTSFYARTVNLSAYDGHPGGDATFGNLTMVIADAMRLNAITVHGYDAVGNRTSVRDPNINTTTYGFDAQRLVQITPPTPFTANVTQYGYDPDGRLICVQRAITGGNAPCAGSGGGWQTTTTTYGFTGEVATATDRSGNTTTYSYDAADRLSSVTDPEGRVTANSAYDADGRVVAVAKGTAGSLIPVEFRTYTQNGLLASRQEVQSAASFNLTTTTPDGFDRPGVTLYQDGTTETVAYAVNTDNPDYLLTRAGQTVTRTYDALNRLASKTGDPSVTYGYDYVGRLLAATTTASLSGDPLGTWAIAYDFAGRRLKDTMPDGKTMGYGWDKAGNRTSVTYPDGKAVQTLYDQLNRAYEIDYFGPAELDSLDALDRVVLRGFAEPVGFNTTYSYAGTDTLVTQIVQAYGASGSATYSYTYNRAGPAYRSRNAVSTKPATSLPYSDATGLTDGGGA